MGRAHALTNVRRSPLPHAIPPLRPSSPPLPPVSRASAAPSGLPPPRRELRRLPRVAPVRAPRRHAALPRRTPLRPRRRPNDAAQPPYSQGARALASVTFTTAGAATTTANATAKAIVVVWSRSIARCCCCRHSSGRRCRARGSHRGAVSHGGTGLERGRPASGHSNHSTSDTCGGRTCSCRATNPSPSH